jgi:hypothetical protein
MKHEIKNRRGPAARAVNDAALLGGLPEKTRAARSRAGILSGR